VQSEPKSRRPIVYPPSYPLPVKTIVPVLLSSLYRAASGDYVVNHFMIAKKMVKELLLYDAPDFRKIMFSEGLEASLV
jgi:hypothetical protein